MKNAITVGALAASMFFGDAAVSSEHPASAPLVYSSSEVVYPSSDTKAQLHGRPPSYLYHYTVKLLREGKVIEEFNLDLRGVETGSGALATPSTGVVKIQTGQPFTKGCTATKLGQGGSEVQLENGMVTSGLDLTASRDTNGTDALNVNAILTELTELRTVKNGDGCMIQLPATKVTTESFVVDVPPGGTVSRPIAGSSNFELVITQKPAP